MMEQLSTIITPGTAMRKILVTQGISTKKESGWLACVINGELKELYMFHTNHFTRFVNLNGVHYEVPEKLKPISGVFDAQTLRTIH